jgi:hypothetical protein
MQEFYCTSHDAIRYRVTFSDNKFIFESLTPKDDPALVQENKRQKMISDIVFKEHDMAVAVLDINKYIPGRKYEYNFYHDSLNGGEVWKDPGYSDETMTIKWDTETTARQIKKLVGLVENSSKKKDDIRKRISKISSVIYDNTISDKDIDILERCVESLEKLLKDY